MAGETTEKILPTGAKLTVTPAGFLMADALNTAIGRAVKGVPIGADFLKQELGGDLKDLVLSIGTSAEVKAALWPCAQYASYEGRKVNVDLFDDVKVGAQARRDYFAIMAEIIKTNCSPFFEQALSALKGKDRPGEADPA